MVAVRWGVTLHSSAFLFGVISRKSGNFQRRPRMHILYIDESGSPENSDDRVFVLAGVAVFERGLYHQIKAADDCVASFDLGDPHQIELHGSPMYSGRAFWGRVTSRPVRERMISQALATLHDKASITLFAVIVEKASLGHEDVVKEAFEQICNRFNLFLRRQNERLNDNQRGLIVMDETKHQKPLQALARDFRVDGGKWGHYRNLAEVPLFVDSMASRMIQLADLVAWATYRRYQYSDGRFFEPLLPLFDASDGVIHGLYHHRSHAQPCALYCPACMSRSQARSDAVVRV